MTDQQLHETVMQFIKIDHAIRPLDESVRATAFALLAQMYLSGEKYKAGGIHGKSVRAKKELADKLTQFAAAFRSEHPADNVLTLVAWLYAHCGVYPIATREISDLADLCNLPIPLRPDGTMRGACENGNRLFERQGRGWCLTPPGEAYIKKRFKINS
jgi:hypothetical protein